MIEINNLHKSFGRKKVLDGIDLRIETGDTICIIGKSGSGKSVLIKNIVGLMYPNRGQILVDGKDIEALSRTQLFELRNDFGYVFQSAALFDSFTVYENIILKMYEQGQRDNSKLEEEALRVLSAVSLLPPLAEKDSRAFKREWKILKEKAPSDLSGGMKKRVGVARALVGNPSYIFYDEPTTGLDPVTSEQVDNLIAELTRTLNVTSIVITHDMFSVFKIAQKVAMLHDGKVHFVGNADELQNSDDPVVSEFIARFM